MQRLPQPASLAPVAGYLLHENDPEPSLSTLQNAFTSAVLPSLLKTPVLRTLSTLQRTLDVLDIEGLSQLWNLAYESAAVQADADGVTIPPVGAGLEEPSLADWKTFLDIYLAKHSQMDHDHPDSANIKYYCMAYLLSASFKDCSIIIRIPREGHGTVTIIDLDVKPVDRLNKWAKLDSEIVETYRLVSEPATALITLRSFDPQTMKLSVV